VKEAGSLRGAFEKLGASEREEIRQRVGSSFLGEIFSIAKQQNAQVFWEDALRFGVRLRRANRLEASAQILGMLSQQATSPEVKGQAAREYGAVTGVGSSGMRMEMIAENFIRQENAVGLIFPMIAASAVGQVGGTAAWRYLTQRTAAGILTRGLTARGLAKGISLLAEAPLFAASTAYLSGETVRMEDVYRAGLSLGALHVFGFAGRQGVLRMHGINELGAVTRLKGLSKVTAAVVPQVAMFGGMMGAHELEGRLGLRTVRVGETVVSDVLGSMVGMQVGLAIGTKFMGRGWANWRREMEARTEYSAKYRESKDAAQAPWAQQRLAPAVVGISSGGSAFRKSAESPLALASRPLMMTALGNNGGSRGAAGYSSGHPEIAELKAANEAFGVASDEATRADVIQSIRTMELGSILDLAEGGHEQANFALEIAAHYKHPHAEGVRVIRKILAARRAPQDSDNAELLEEIKEKERGKEKDLGPVVDLAIRGYSKASDALKAAAELGHPYAAKLPAVVEVHMAYRAYERGDSANIKEEMRKRDLTPLVELAEAGSPNGVSALVLAKYLDHPRAQKALRKLKPGQLTFYAKLSAEVYEHFLAVEELRFHTEQENQKRYDGAVMLSGEKPDPKQAKREAAQNFRRDQKKLFARLKALNQEGELHPGFVRAMRAEEAVVILSDNGNREAGRRSIEIDQWKDILMAHFLPLEGVPILVEWAQNSKGRLKQLAEDALRDFNAADLISLAEPKLMVNDHDSRADKRSVVGEEAQALKAQSTAINHLLTLALYEHQGAKEFLPTLYRNERVKRELKNLPDNILYRKKGFFMYWLHQAFGGSDESKPPTGIS
jgi:hypothetical protein